MFENVVPEYKIGWLQPSSVVDVAAYEFYRIAPPRVMLVILPLGVSEFSDESSEDALSPLDQQIDKLMDRGVHMIVMHGGLPTPLRLGIEAHDRLIEYIATRSGLPATSTLLCVVRSAAHLAVAKLAMANTWDDEINKTIAKFFARSQIEICGVATKTMGHKDFVRLSGADQLTLAYELGRQAFLENPSCEGLYLGGGSWPAEPVAVQLEQEFGRPVISHRPAMVRHSLQLLNAWRPLPGHGRLFALE